MGTAGLEVLKALNEALFEEWAIRDRLRGARDLMALDLGFVEVPHHQSRGSGLVLINRSA